MIKDTRIIDILNDDYCLTQDENSAYLVDFINCITTRLEFLECALLKYNDINIIRDEYTKLLNTLRKEGFIK